MRTKYTVECNCGHTGTINLTENDQPYSEMYESWSLSSLEGNICNTPKSADDILTRSNIRCPMCKSQLTKDNLQ